MRLYECSIRFGRMMETGKIQTVTEQHLVDALTFTEAEAPIIKERTPYILGEYDVVAIKRTRYIEIVNAHADCDKWFEVKVNLISFDERTKKERKTAVYYIVNADSNQEAHQLTVDFMKGTLADYDIATVKETAILEVYRYEAATTHR